MKTKVFKPDQNIARATSSTFRSQMAKVVQANMLIPKERKVVIRLKSWLV